MVASGSLRRTWDSYDVYLFDIDGTLLHCTDAVHYYAFRDVLQSLAGRPVPLEKVAAHGNTDLGIVRDALRLSGVSDSVWRPKIQEIMMAMWEYVQARQEDICARELPGAREVLQYLQDRGAALGVATGNLEAIGRLKLQRAGLLRFFTFGCWSDECESRSDVFRTAGARMQPLQYESRSICVVGDTPADIVAARENGFRVIAVATGVHSADALRAERPDLCVESLKALLDDPQYLSA